MRKMYFFFTIIVCLSPCLVDSSEIAGKALYCTGLQAPGTGYTFNADTYDTHEVIGTKDRHIVHRVSKDKPYKLTDSKIFMGESGWFIDRETLEWIYFIPKVQSKKKFLFFTEKETKMVAKFGGTCKAYKNHKQALENIQRDADYANARFKKNPCRPRTQQIILGYNSHLPECKGDKF